MLPRLGRWERLADTLDLIWDAFISYSRADKRLAKVIEHDLVVAGLTVWRDEAAVRLGGRIREAVDDGIRNSASVLVIISPRSLASPWVLNELDAAMLREIRERRTVVIPILTGTARVEDLPTDLQGKLFVDLRGGFDRLWQARRARVIAALRVASDPFDREREVTVPVGDELIGHFIGHRFRAEADSDVAVRLAGAFAEGLLSEVFDAKDESRVREDFLRLYGSVTLRQLVLFWMDIHSLTPTRGFDDDQVFKVLMATNITLLAFAAAEGLTERGLRLWIRIHGTDDPMFMATSEGDLPDWSAERPSDDELRALRETLHNQR